MNKKIKKRLIILGSTLLAGFLIFTAAWLVFYYCVAKPHLPASYYIEPDTPSMSSYFYYDSPDNAYGNYDNFYYLLPKFGTFRCIAGFTSSRNYLEDEGALVNASGSKFSYSMFGRIGWNGKIKGYTISASYYSSPKVTMPEAVFFKLDPDGNLVNTESQTTRSLELFEEAKPEILEYIRKIEEIYGC